MTDNLPEKMSDATLSLVNTLSATILKLHKALLDDSKIAYEAEFGPIPNVQKYFELVIDHQHFAWLRKLSSLVALMDQATIQRRLATEGEAQALLDEAKILLSFKDMDEAFNAKFKSAVEANETAAGFLHEVIKLID